MTSRRSFITLLGSAAAAWPMAARAQQAAMPVIGFLGSESADLWAGPLRALRQGLSEIGYVEGRNVAIEYRWAESHNDRLLALAADLVDRQVNVIVAPGSTPAALAAKAATAVIPVVFDTAVDPVAAGLVASLNRPGANITGVTTLGIEIGPKRLEILHELIPTATIVALLINPTNPTLADPTMKEVQTAAQMLRLQLHVLRASAERDFDAAFATLAQLRAGALVIGADPLFTGRSEQLAALALHYAMPAIYQSRPFAAAGGLVSYGIGPVDLFYQVGVYTGRILNGEKPSDLPVQQATKVELIINMKTAKALGLAVPITLLGRADEVIE